MSVVRPSRFMKVVPVAFALPVAFAAAVPAIAGDCSDASTTYEMNMCADAEFGKADQKLNRAYQSLLAQIARSDGEHPYDKKSWENALRVSQRAWIAYRDADCKGLVPMGWGGGTGTTAAVLGCMIGKTEERTKELLDHQGQ